MTARREIRCLGVDPGSHRTGWGVVAIRGRHLWRVASGHLAPSRSSPLEARLGYIARALRELVVAHRPERAGVEEVYLAGGPGGNVRTALVIGAARGAVLAALGEVGIPCKGYAHKTVKSAVAGSGLAGKADVRRAVAALLRLESEPQEDEGDALAVGICSALAAWGEILPTARGSDRYG